MDDRTTTISAAALTALTVVLWAVTGLYDNSPPSLLILTVLGVGLVALALWSWRLSRPFMANISQAYRFRRALSFELKDGRELKKAFTKLARMAKRKQTVKRTKTANMLAATIRLAYPEWNQSTESLLGIYSPEYAAKLSPPGEDYRTDDLNQMRLILVKRYWRLEGILEMGPPTG